ncbi:MAG: tetratricopeptide repeat protein [Myxococcota bacterium]
MSGWQTWRGGSARPPSDDALFEALSAAVDQGDGDGLNALCATHAEQIVAATPRWARVPEPLRSDPAAVRRWGRTVAATAQHLAALGDARMLRRLSGGPLERWAAHREQAVALARDDRLEEALGLVEPDLAQMRAHTFDDPSPLDATVGLVGQLRYLAGRAEQAVPLLEEARERVAARGGDPSHYDVLLEQALRWLGRGDAPALQVQLCEGEPVFVRSVATLPRAAALAARGCEGVRWGDLPGARAALERAARADRNDPASRYQLAFVLLQSGEVAAAVALQEQVERIAPGWYDNRAWLALSRRIAAAEVPHAVVAVLHQLEGGRIGPVQRAALAAGAAAQWPVAQLYRHLGLAQADLGRVDDARAAFRAGLAVVGADPHTRSQLLADRAEVSPPEEQAGLWAEAAAVEGGSLVVQALARSGPTG